MDVVLSPLELVALALADGTARSTSAGEAVPDAVWQGLHERGLLVLTSFGVPGADLESAPSKAGDAALVDGIAALAVAPFEPGSWAMPLAKGDLAVVTVDVLLEGGDILAAGQRGTVFAVTDGAVGFEWLNGGATSCVALAAHKVRAA